MKNFAFKLFAFAALLLIGTGAMAQQSGTNAFVGSTHLYQSSKSTLNGTMSWAIVPAAAGTITPAADGLSATVVWSTATSGTPHQVTVTETFNDCSTSRSIDVTVIPNTFNLALTAPIADCAAGSGTIIPDGATSPGNTTVTFNVAVTGDLSKPSKFDYAISTTTSADISSVTIDNSIYTGASLTGTNLTIPTGVSTFTISVVVVSRFNILDDISLSLSNAKDFYGTSETSLTDNNGTTTIKAVPNTSSITTD